MLIFEPHNGFGAKNRDGEPWPYGYISEADTPTSIPSPIFELSPVLGTPELWAKTVIRMAAADDLLAALKAARRYLVVAIGANVTGMDFDPKDHVVIQQIDAVTAKAEGETP